MIYELSREQWYKIWTTNHQQNWFLIRKMHWNKKYPNLIYNESPEHYWGTIEGTEKDINWFILHL